MATPSYTNYDEAVTGMSGGQGFSYLNQEQKDQLGGMTFSDPTRQSAPFATVEPTVLSSDKTGQIADYQSKLASYQQPQNVGQYVTDQDGNKYYFGDPKFDELSKQYSSPTATETTSSNVALDEGANAAGERGQWITGSDGMNRFYRVGEITSGGTSGSNDPTQDPLYQQSLGLIDKMSAQVDARTKALIDGIKQRYTGLIEQQKQINRGMEGSIGQSLLMGGSSRYAQLSSAGIDHTQVSYGLSQIANLNAMEAQEIAAAEQAAQDQDFQLMGKKLELVEKARAQKQAEMQKLNATLMEQSQKVQEANMQSQRDSAITGIISSGISDPLEIMKKLRAMGRSDITFDSVADITERLAQQDKFFPGLPGELQAAVKAGQVPPDTTLGQFAFMKDPMKALQMQKEQLEIQKLEKEINADPGAFGGLDAPNALAYAQEYATTGKIPTGLPKGAFGAISQMAKELPKATGVIVNKMTGVSDSKIAATEQQDYSRLYNITNNIKRLKELDAKRMGGLIGGTLGAIFGENDQQAYMTIRKSIIDDMQRMQSGAALTVEESEYYADYLPGRFSDTPGFSNWFFSDSKQKIENFEKIIDNRLRERLDVNGLSLYGYSKVDIGGKQYTVGDVVTNSSGLSGRVLPDGSIATDEEPDTGQDFSMVGNTQASNRPQRNNNPLNIKASAFTRAFPGVKGTDPKDASDGGKFLTFDTPEAGFAAAKRLIQSTNYKNLTVNQAMKRWSNSGYGGEVASTLKNRTINSLTPSELDTLIKAMAKREGYFG